MRNRIWLAGLVLLWPLGSGSGPAWADFYVVPTPGFSGVPIKSVPLTIASPGFYCFTKDLEYSGTAVNAIKVNAHDVTIALMGFSLVGPGKESGGEDGILVNSRTNVGIRNGTILDFGDDGVVTTIPILTPVVNCQTMLNLRVIGNGGHGIRLFGQGNIVKGCRAEENGQGGIHVGSRSLVSGNSSDLNGGAGIFVGNDSVIVENSCYGNDDSGIIARVGCVISNDASRANWSIGGLEVG